MDEIKVSACMIVKDEQASIVTALESLDGLADEIVVVDTGSTDRTVDILRERGATVIEGGDRMHKGAMRNKAQENATGDWIFFLDGDEELEDAAALRGYLENVNGVDAVYLRAVRCNGSGEPVSSQQQMRCWRQGTVAYKYRAHEVPVGVNGRLRIAHTDHTFYNRPRKRPGAMQYTLDRLLLDVKENPDAARPLFYLGRQWFYMKRWRKARETLGRYVEQNPRAWDAADAFYYLSKCYEHDGETSDAITALHQAIARRPRRREFWGRLAEIHYENRSYDLAAAMLCAALEIEPPTVTYRIPMWYGAHIHDFAARCYWKMGRVDVGRVHAERAVELEPDNERLIKNLSYFRGEGDQDS